MNQLLTLGEYTTISKKIVNKYLQKKGKPPCFDYDLWVGEILYTLCKSDISYNPNHPKAFTLQKWRGFKVNCTIKHIMRKNYLYQTKKKHLIKNLLLTGKAINKTSDYDMIYKEEVSDKLDYLINNSNLTEHQLKLVGYVRAGISNAEIVKLTGTTKENIFQIIDSAIFRMRKTANVA